MSPFFSVIVPTYNRPQLLHRTLQSVMRQRFADYEVIVSDDCSPQRLDHLVAGFADARIRLIRSKRNEGNAAARNRGVRAARGHWIAFVDDDDEMLPEHLSHAHRILENADPSLGFMWSGVEWVEDTPTGECVLLRRELWNPQFCSRDEAFHSFLRTRHVGTGTGFVVRRDVVAEIGFFDERLRTAVDTDFVLRIVQRYDFRVLPAVTMRVHAHQGEHVRKARSHNAAAYELIIQKHFEALERRPEAYGALLYKMGWLYYHAGDRTRGRGAMLRALQERPLWFKVWVAIVFFELIGTRAPELHEKFSSWVSGLRKARRSFMSV